MQLLKKCGILAWANPTPNIDRLYRIMQILGSVTFYPGQFRLGRPFPTIPLFSTGGRYKCRTFVISETF